MASRLTEAGKAFWNTLLDIEQDQIRRSDYRPAPEIAKSQDLSMASMGSGEWPGFGQHPQGVGVPDSVNEAMAKQGMITGGPWSPGRPIQQFAPSDMPPLQFEVPVGYNVSTRPRALQGRLSFWTMNSILQSWDVGRLCIEHLEDDIRSFEWDILPARGVSEDVRDQCDKARDFLDKPDGETPFDSWLNMGLEDLLRFDAMSLYRERNRAGDVKGIQVLSGMTIAPLVDYLGHSPVEEAPRQVQFRNGIPWVWMYEGDLIYTPFRLLPESPYGYPPIEWLLMTANTDVRFQWHFLNWFTEGTVADTYMEAPPDQSDPEELAKFQATWDAVMEGQQKMKHKVRWIPSGSKPTPAAEKNFDINFPLYLMRKTCAAYKVTPADIGITDQVNKASSETQVDVQFRIGTAPRLNYIQGVLTRILQKDLGLPVRFVFDTGREKQDRLQEAQAMDFYVKMGAISPDEVRQDILNKEISADYPTPRFIFSNRVGAIPLKSIAEIAGDQDPRTASYKPKDIDITQVDKIREAGPITPSGVLPDKNDLHSRKKQLEQGMAPQPQQPGQAQGGVDTANVKEEAAKGVGAASASRSTTSVDNLILQLQETTRQVEEARKQLARKRLSLIGGK